MKVKGRRFDVRRKMKESNGKMKKIEATLIKMLMRINWYLFSIQFWSSLSILSLTHSWTLRVFLEHFSIGSRKEKKEKRKENIKKGRAGSSIYNKITCRYRFACMISMLDLACMVMHVCFWFSCCH